MDTAVSESGTDYSSLWPVSLSLSLSLQRWEWLGPESSSELLNGCESQVLAERGLLSRVKFIY